MTIVYDLLEAVKKELDSNPLVNTVSFGYIPEVEMMKTTIYPLSHIYMPDGFVDGGLITFNLEIYCLDQVDENKESVSDLFIGNDNLQDVLNEQMQVMLALISAIRQNTSALNIRLSEDSVVTWEVINENMGKDIYGYKASIPIIIQNTNLLC